MLNQRNEITESPKSKAKRFVSAPKKRSKHVTLQNLFLQLKKNTFNSAMQLIDPYA